jgi:hypothetical protein
MAYNVIVNGSVVASFENESDAIARVEKDVGRGRNAYYVETKQFNPWEYIERATSITINSVDDMDRAFRADMNRGYYVDGDHEQFKCPEFITYDELSRDQKSRIRECGLSWDRAGRIGTATETLTREAVISLLSGDE